MDTVSHIVFDYRMKLIRASENDIEGIVELTFSIDDEKFGERDTIDLIPDGRNIPVTNENKHKYVE